MRKPERACDHLIMCIITTLNQGLRNGGGIGDVLRKPSSSVSKALDCVLSNSVFYLVHVLNFYMILGIDNSHRNKDVPIQATMAT